MRYCIFASRPDVMSALFTPQILFETILFAMTIFRLYGDGIVIAGLKRPRIIRVVERDGISYFLVSRLTKHVATSLIALVNRSL